MGYIKSVATKGGGWVSMCVCAVCRRLAVQIAVHISGKDGEKEIKCKME